MISLGGDADTMGAITGSIAWAYYGRNGITDDMKAIWAEARDHIPGELIARIDAFEEFKMNNMGFNKKINDNKKINNKFIY